MPDGWTRVRQCQLLDKVALMQRLIAIPFPAALPRVGAASPVLPPRNARREVVTPDTAAVRDTLALAEGEEHPLFA